jgi:Angiotensin-converting enzyme
MWGRFWNNLYKYLVPFPDKPSLDPTEAMKKQNYTVQKMFETGNEFYVKMGLYPVPDRYQPEGRVERLRACFHNGKNRAKKEQKKYYLSTPTYRNFHRYVNTALIQLGPIL